MYCTYLWNNQVIQSMMQVFTERLEIMMNMSNTDLCIIVFISCFNISMWVVVVHIIKYIFLLFQNIGSDDLYILFFYITSLLFLEFLFLLLFHPVRIFWHLVHRQIHYWYLTMLAIHFDLPMVSTVFKSQYFSIFNNRTKKSMWQHNTIIFYTSNKEEFCFGKFSHLSSWI